MLLGKIRDSWLYLFPTPKRNEAINKKIEAFVEKILINHKIMDYSFPIFAPASRYTTSSLRTSPGRKRSKDTTLSSAMWLLAIFFFLTIPNLYSIKKQVNNRIDLFFYCLPFLLIRSNHRACMGYC